MAHATGTCPVYIGTGLLEQLPALVARHLAGRRTALIADDTVAALYREYLSGTPMPWHLREWSCNDASPPGWPDPLVFPAGESSKTRGNWAALTDALLEGGFGRDAGIVALGGGVTGDLAGFVAATYMRGIPVVQVPTTLLAMLDASVGGKTGVDTMHGKNLVGAFHQPAAVVADPLTLLTLSDRDYRSGLAEAVKHGLVADAEQFSWLRAVAPAIGRRDAETVGELVRRSVAVKAAIVAQDEREEGRRAVLNAGHTVAHALEQATGFALTHGQAVALGLVAECAIGERMGVTAWGTGAEVASLLERLGLPTRTPIPLTVSAILAPMRVDKKARESTVRFALPAGIGGGETDRWTVEAPPEAVSYGLRAIGAEVDKG